MTLFETQVVVAERFPTRVENKLWKFMVPVEYKVSISTLGKFGRHCLVLPPVIYFRSGILSTAVWDPKTPQGMSLIAHEMFHVYQYHRDGGVEYLGYLWNLIRAGLFGKDWHSAGYEQEAMRLQERVFRHYQQNPEEL